VTSTVRLIGLTGVALPIFFGLTPFPESAGIVPGITWAAVFYAAVSMAGVAFFGGWALLANTLAVTALIASPVVFAGGLISWLLAILGGTTPGTAGSVHGAHYVRLALNMLSVIPVALALVVSIPFDRLEQKLLRRPRGIAMVEKYLLMFVRVFNHIVYFVIPNLLEVMREEALLRNLSANPFARPESRGLFNWGHRLLAGLIHVGVSGICASLRFIPLWAREIDDLPERPPQ